MRLRNDIGDLTSDYNHGTELNHWRDVKASDDGWLSAALRSDAVTWLGDAAGLLPSLPSEFDRRDAVHWRLGQLMFVPEKISQATPDPRDRPYAGWLYTGLASERLALDPDATRRHDQRARVELNLGILGPSSLSDDVQIQWHEIWDLSKPRGWGHQLKDEPTLLVAAQRDLRLAWGEAFGTHEWDLAGHFDWNLGNVRTSANVGAVARFGKALPRDFGFRSRPDPEVGAGGGSVFLFGDVHAIAQDLFLDGNTWKDGPSVDKEPYVGEWGLGFDVNLGAVQLRLGHLWRSREFETQADAFEGVWFLEAVL